MGHSGIDHAVLQVVTPRLALQHRRRQLVLRIVRIDDRINDILSRLLLGLRHVEVARVSGLTLDRQEHLLQDLIIQIGLSERRSVVLTTLVWIEEHLDDHCQPTRRVTVECNVGIADLLACGASRDSESRIVAIHIEDDRRPQFEVERRGELSRAVAHEHGTVRVDQTLLDMSVRLIGPGDPRDFYGASPTPHGLSWRVRSPVPCRRRRSKDRLLPSWSRASGHHR